MAHSIITIGREYGSGGRFIGRKVAQRLDIPFYDKELITVTAQQSGFCEQILESNDEKHISNLMYAISPVGRFVDNLPLNHRVFLAQFKAIQYVAQQGPCVIVGRCSDYALRERDDCVNVFVHAPFEERIKRVVKYYGVPADRAEEVVKKTDKNRANYYNHFSDHKWGDLHGYHLCLDSHCVGIEGAVRLILQCVAEFEQIKR